MPKTYKKIHLGCGSVYFSEWLNIDLDSPVADLHLDLTKPLPFEDCSATHIFNEHFIEHISRTEALKFLIECRRVLSFNGVIRITTPNLRFLIASYLVSKKNEWGELWQPNTPCLMINEGMRSWGHQFVYDADELVRLLIDAGFNTISFQEYRQSLDKELCELESRPFHNEIIIEAKKTEDTIQSIDYKALENYENQWSIKLNSNKELLQRIKLAEKVSINQVKQIKEVEQDCSARSLVIAGLEQELVNQANHIQNIEADWTARGQVIIDQANHIQNIEADWTARGQVIIDQANHIQNIEADWTARGQVIIDQANHIQNIEADWTARGQVIIDQANHIQNIEADWTARGQVIIDQANHIQNIEADWTARGQVIIDQANHIQNIEADWTARGQVIIDQANHIQNIEAALLRLHSSLYGKCISGLSRLSSFIKK